MENLEGLIEEFHREGFLVLPRAISRDEAECLRQGVERAFEAVDDVTAVYGNLGRIWRPLMFEHGPEFEALVDNPRVLPLLDAILGPQCHLIANSALRTGPGDGISSWHADEEVRFPLPPGMKLDPAIQMPCYIINLNYYLCDVDEALGPTQWVPGSHRSGRAPQPEDRDANGDPWYEGRGPYSGVGEAGTAVLWHDQTWHRGAPNRTSDRTRWVQQAPFGRRWVSQRFYPFVNYQLPQGVMDRANPVRRRVLGLHGPGAYG
jgi:ectoine hydroxylase-related dioxygenase (phytanoyl-CoA dioxygenase family)